MAAAGPHRDSDKGARGIDNDSGGHASEPFYDVPLDQPANHPSQMASVSSSATATRSRAPAASTAARTATVDGVQQVAGEAKRARERRAGIVARVEERAEAEVTRDFAREDGVRVEGDKGRPFPLFLASARDIAESSVGLGLYFNATLFFKLAAVVLSALSIYPLVASLSADGYTESFTEVRSDGTEEVLPRNIEVTSFIMNMSSGAFCSPPFASPYACPAICALPGVDTDLLSVSDCRQEEVVYCNEPASLCNNEEELGSIPAGFGWIFAMCAVVLYTFKLLVAVARDDVMEVIDEACVDPADYTVYVRGLPKIKVTQGLRHEIASFFAHYGDVLSVNLSVSEVSEAEEINEQIRRKQLLRDELQKLDDLPEISFLQRLYTFRLGSSFNPKRASTRVTGELDVLHGKQSDLLNSGARTCSGKAFVIFQKQRGAVKCALDHHRVNFDGVLEKLLGQQTIAKMGHSCWTSNAPLLSVKDSESEEVFQRHLIISRAPPPSDVVWSNLYFTGGKARAVKLASFAITLVVIGVAAVIQVFLQRAVSSRRTELNQQEADILSPESASLIGLTLANGIIVAILNIIISIVIDVLQEFEGWHTLSSKESRVIWKLTFGQLINSIVPVFTFDRQDWYIRGGLVEVAFWLQVTNSFLPNLVDLSDLNLRLKRFFARHSSINEAIMYDLMKPPIFDLVKAYSADLRTIGTAALYSPLLPASWMIALFALFTSYWSNKYLALRRRSPPTHLGDGSLSQQVTRILTILAVLQLVGLRVFLDETGAAFWVGLAILLGGVAISFVRASIKHKIQAAEINEDQLRDMTTYREAVRHGLQKESTRPSPATSPANSPRPVNFVANAWSNHAKIAHNPKLYLPPSKRYTNYLPTIPLGAEDKSMFVFFEPPIPGNPEPMEGQLKQSIYSSMVQRRTDAQRWPPANRSQTEQGMEHGAPRGASKPSQQAMPSRPPPHTYTV